MLTDSLYNIPNWLHYLYAANVIQHTNSQVSILPIALEEHKILVQEIWNATTKFKDKAYSGVLNSCPYSGVFQSFKHKTGLKSNLLSAYHEADWGVGCYSTLLCMSMTFGIQNIMVWSKRILNHKWQKVNCTGPNICISNKNKTLTLFLKNTNQQNFFWVAFCCTRKSFCPSDLFFFNVDCSIYV